MITLTSAQFRQFLIITDQLAEMRTRTRQQAESVWNVTQTTLDINEANMTTVHLMAQTLKCDIYESLNQPK